MGVCELIFSDSEKGLVLACSTSDVVWANSAKFVLHTGNMKFYR